MWSSFWGVESDLDSESESEGELFDSDEDEDLALLDFLLFLTCFFECFLCACLADLAAFFAAFLCFLSGLSFLSALAIIWDFFGIDRALCVAFMVDIKATTGEGGTFNTGPDVWAGSARVADSSSL